MLKALVQFMGSFISATSRYDKYLQDPGKHPFSTDEKSGMAIFEQKCGSCHAPPLFTDNSYRNNGLDETFVDSGRFHITNINSMKNNVDAIASQIAMIPALEITI